MQNARELALEFLALTDQQDWRAREQLLAPDVEFVIPVGTFRGPEAATAFSASFMGAFPGAAHVVDTVVATDDAVAIEGIWTGTHTAPLAMPDGDVPATGATVVLPFTAFHTIADGRLTSIRVYFDSAAMLGPLGLLSAPASATSATA